MCTEIFNVEHFPTMILSDSSGMYPCIKLGPNFLCWLMAKPGEMQRFLTQIHCLMMRDTQLDKINAKIRTKDFWRHVKTGVKELKAILSVSISLVPGKQE